MSRNNSNIFLRIYLQHVRSALRVSCTHVPEHRQRWAGGPQAVIEQISRKEDDGTFIVLMQSTEHPKAPLPAGPWWQWVHARPRRGLLPKPPVISVVSATEHVVRPRLKIVHDA